jgi:transcriptional regulator with XRE-family HTH domain
MWYHSINRTPKSGKSKGGVVSALTDFIRYRMDVLKKNQSEVAADAGIGEPALSYIMTKKKEVRPTPDTIKGLAKAREVRPALLTSLLGYPVEPIPDIDERLYEIARQLLVAPWVADRIDDLLKVPRGEFDELMRYLEFRRNPPGESGNQSTP